MLYLRWTMLQIKLHMRSVSFWIFIAAAALLLFLSDRYRGVPDKTILLQNGDNDIQKAVCGNMLGDSLPGYIFAEEDSEDEIKRRIAGGEAVCGICFDAKPGDRADEIEIVVYATPKTLDGMIIQEVVFPYLLKERSKDMMKEYLEEKGTASGDSDEILRIHREYLKKGNISIFTVIEEEEARGRISPVRTDLRAVLFTLLGGVMIIWYAVVFMYAGHPIYRAVGTACATRLRLMGAAVRIAVSIIVLSVINVFIMIT